MLVLLGREPARRLVMKLGHSDEPRELVSGGFRIQGGTDALVVPLNRVTTQLDLDLGHPVESQKASQV